MLSKLDIGPRESWPTMWFAIRCVATALVIEVGVVYAALTRADVPFSAHGVYAIAALDLFVAFCMWSTLRCFYAQRERRRIEADRKAPVVRYERDATQKLVPQKARPLLDDSLGRF